MKPLPTMSASTSGSNLIGWPSGDTSKSWEETYTYDAQNRLTNACMNYPSCSHYYSYAYDANGDARSPILSQFAQSKSAPPAA